VARGNDTGSDVAARISPEADCRGARRVRGDTPAFPGGRSSLLGPPTRSALPDRGSENPVEPAPRPIGDGHRRLDLIASVTEGRSLAPPARASPLQERATKEKPRSTWYTYSPPPTETKVSPMFPVYSVTYVPGCTLFVHSRKRTSKRCVDRLGSSRRWLVTVTTL
jgi:hypothetical protein